MADVTREFIKAAKKGDLAGLKALLESDSNLISAQDSDGSTALHCAAWKGHTTVVDYLLAAGAEVNKHNNNDHWGTTPLHAAAHANQATIAQRLIVAGADVNAKDMKGMTPLYHTTLHNAKAAAKILAQNGGV